jgi:hypothetical protein
VFPKCQGYIWSLSPLEEAGHHGLEGPWTPLLTVHKAAVPDSGHICRSSCRQWSRPGKHSTDHCVNICSWRRLV